ncbi:carbonyl reductase [Melanomma pulvis-pyrius CBS 109.77]|uniref:Carbonyl reductase n=1 Tax=Melanomma pulvis-pyrius CBS 109.77 TaxID=1314802 RepID=A0A6A6WWZ1_9PLEO|nr:carbonyl reductase [Melanomma pulvis-pyrius CBS 109.77]
MATQNRPIVLITGANQGIGLTTARILAEEHSFHVIIGSRIMEAGEKAASDLRSHGHMATSLQLDLNSAPSIDAAITTIAQDFGYLDVLINNAGIFLDFDPTLSKYDLYTKTFQTNVVGPAALTDGLLPLLRKAKCGPPRIIFVSSSMGSIDLSKDKTTPWYHLDCKAYDTSKAAANMLMVNYDRIMDGTGAKVNSVCPGKVATNLTGYDGVDLETGASRIVEIAVAGDEGVSGTFTNRDGPLPF